MRADFQNKTLKIEEQKAEANKPEGANLGDYIADTVKAPRSWCKRWCSQLILSLLQKELLTFSMAKCKKKVKTEEGYQTEWDSLLYGDGDPLETKTWWGGLVRTVTEVVTTIALTGGFGGVGKAQKARTLASTLKEGALLGLE